MLKRGMTPIHPGLVLKEMYLEPLDISVTDFANKIGVTRKTVSMIVNEHSGISAEMALRLSKAFNTAPELWLNIQQKYDLWNASQNLSLKTIKYITTRESFTKPERRLSATKRPAANQTSKH